MAGELARGGHSAELVGKRNTFSSCHALGVNRENLSLVYVPGPTGQESDTDSG